MAHGSEQREPSSLSKKINKGSKKYKVITVDVLRKLELFQNEGLTPASLSLLVDELRYF